MAKAKKEKSVTKDTLIGMRVIDAEGNAVGSIHDVAFTVGKMGMSLSVETASGEKKEFPWEEIQAVGEFVILKPVTRSTDQVAVHPAQETRICPTCGGPLNYIEKYQRWYCYKCKKYV